MRPAPAAALAGAFRSESERKCFTAQKMCRFVFTQGIVKVVAIIIIIMKQTPSSLSPLFYGAQM